MGQGNSRADERSATSPTSSHPASDAAELLQIVQQRKLALDEARGEHVPGYDFWRKSRARRQTSAEIHRQRVADSKPIISHSKWLAFTSQLAGCRVYNYNNVVILATSASCVRPSALTLLKRVVSASQGEDVLRLQSGHRDRGYVPAIPERSREQVTQALSANVSDSYAATWVLELENCCRTVDRLCEALKQSEPESTEFTKLSIVLAFVKAYFLLAFAIPGMACGKQYVLIRVCSGDVNLLCAQLMLLSADALKTIPNRASGGWVGWDSWGRAAKSSDRDDAPPHKRAPAASAHITYSCVCCNAADNEDMVVCDGCDRWFHFDCAGFADLTEVPSGDDPFFCRQCFSAPCATEWRRKNWRSPTLRTACCTRRSTISASTTMPPERRGETSGAEPTKRLRWTPDEENELRTLVGELGPDKWPAVAQRLGTGRSADAVEQHWYITPRASAPSAPREEASAAAPKPAKRARKSTAKHAARSAAKPATPAQPAPSTAESARWRLGRGYKSCPVCGESVGGRANTCPNCGHDYRAERLALDAGPQLSTRTRNGI